MGYLDLQDKYYVLAVPPQGYQPWQQQLLASFGEEDYVREFRTITIGPLPKQHNEKAIALIQKAVSVLGKKPSEIFVSSNDFPFTHMPTVWAEVTFYAVDYEKEFFLCA